MSGDSVVCKQFIVLVKSLMSNIYKKKYFILIYNVWCINMSMPNSTWHLIGSIIMLITINYKFHYWNINNILLQKREKSSMYRHPTMHQLPQSNIYLTRTNTLRIGTCDTEVKYCTSEVQEGMNSWCVALMRKTHEICRKSLSVLLLRITVWSHVALLIEGRKNAETNCIAANSELQL